MKERVEMMEWPQCVASECGWVASHKFRTRTPDSVSRHAGPHFPLLYSGLCPDREENHHMQLASEVQSCITFWTAMDDTRVPWHTAKSKGTGDCGNTLQFGKFRAWLLMLTCVFAKIGQVFCSDEEPWEDEGGLWNSRLQGTLNTYLLPCTMCYDLCCGLWFNFHNSSERYPHFTDKETKRRIISQD
jgi:hypothetical protein